MDFAVTRYAGLADRRLMMEWLAAHQQVEHVHAGDLVWRREAARMGSWHSRSGFGATAASCMGGPGFDHRAALDVVTAPDAPRRAALLEAMLDQIECEWHTRRSQAAIAETIYTFFPAEDRLLFRMPEQRGFVHDPARDAQFLHLPRHAQPRPLHLPVSYAMADLSDRTLVASRVQTREAFGSNIATVASHLGLAASGGIERNLTW